MNVAMTVCGKRLKLSPPGNGTFHSFMARLLLRDTLHSKCLQLRAVSLPRHTQLPITHKNFILYHICGLGSVDVIATGYGLDGPGIESR